MTTAMNRSLAVVTAVSAAGVLAGPAPVQVVGGVLLAFALPGLAVTGILFRGRDLSAVERVLLAPALSLAVLIVSGLLMYAVGVELDRTAWTAATAGVTLLALFAGALPVLRRAALQPPPVGSAREPLDALAGTAARAAMASAAIATGSTTAGSTAAGSTTAGIGTTVLTVLPAPDSAATTAGPNDSAESATVTNPGEPTGPQGPANGSADSAGDDATHIGTGRRRLLRQVLPLILALAVLGGASWLSYSSARDGFETTVTTLSAEPPTDMNPAGLRTVRVSASGLLATEGPYRLVVTGENGRAIAERSVPAVGGSWAESLSVPGRQRLTVHLYRAAEATPYRTLLISPQE